MSAKKAFTLVELLVVIAIIALLISILAPSLKMAKDLTKQMICMTRLSGMAKATLIYVECNRGALPPGRNGDVAKWPYALAVVYTATVAPGIPRADDNGEPLPEGPLSYLLTAQLLVPDVIYCPLTEVAPSCPNRWKRSSYPNPYAKVPFPDAGSAHISASYLFNPNLVMASPYPQYLYKKIDEIPTSAILALDIFLRTYDIVHNLGGSGSEQWAMMFPAGNVNIRGSAKAYEHMYNSGYWGEGDWPLFIAGFKLLQGF